jgi:hypothetical protein
MSTSGELAEESLMMKLPWKASKHSHGIMQIKAAKFPADSHVVVIVCWVQMNEPCSLGRIMTTTSIVRVLYACL